MSPHIKHEKLPKDARPAQGSVYGLAHAGAALYEAEITKYSGGCWATVRVTNPLGNADTYSVGDSFDIRVAMYEFTPLVSQPSEKFEAQFEGQVA